MADILKAIVDQAELQLSARALFDLFRDWLAEQFHGLGLGHGDEAALHLPGRARGVAVMAHVYQDTELRQHELAQLENRVSQFGYSFL